MKYAEGTGWEVEATFGKMNRRTLSPKLEGGGLHCSADSIAEVSDSLRT